MRYCPLCMVPLAIERRSHLAWCVSECAEDVVFDGPVKPSRSDAEFDAAAKRSVRP